MDRLAFLPTTREDMRARNIEQLDFVYIVGDAYVDHPSFGHAIISRVLERFGYSVGIIAQPDFHSTKDITRLGRPRLAFLVSAGNIDSMVNKYSVAKKKRGEDLYSPGGKAGLRPERATSVYCRLIREAYKSAPIAIGGVEASLRRFAHYDYWSNSVRRSILFESGADILLYGMGERAIVELADALASGMDINDVTYIDGVCYKAKTLENVYDYIEIPSFADTRADKKRYAEAFMAQYREQDAFRGKRLAQKHGEDGYLVANPPAKPLSTQELDDVYSLPYQRAWHPDYDALGGIPALKEVKFSLTSCRGCFGGCSFCALTFHQGRVIQSRSHESLIDEAKKLTELPDFKGYIHDVGGPTADLRFPACKNQLKAGVCADKQCLGFTPCKNMVSDHADYIQLLYALRHVEGVKKVFVRSGIRYDYVMYDKKNDFLTPLIKYHVSGQLKVAPEHVSERVLRLMGKPPHEVYDAFVQKYFAINDKLSMEQYIVPYFMSSHPGSDMHSAIELAQYLKKTGQRPEQVQDFYPTPGTLSTCMFYTGFDPRTGEAVYVERAPEKKAMQRALMQFFMPREFALVRKALSFAGRDDLIGYGKSCLVPPERSKKPDDGAKSFRRKK